MNKDMKDLNRTKQKKAFIFSLKQGSTHVEAQIACGVRSYVTIWNWKQEDKDFAKACESALESRIKIVEDALFQSATGKEGKAKIIAQIFWLKNRGKNWKDKQDIEFTAPKEVKQNTFIQAGEEPKIIEEENKEGEETPKNENYKQDVHSHPLYTGREDKKEEITEKKAKKEEKNSKNSRSVSQNLGSSGLLPTSVKT